jgi:hypothetical protein
VVIAFVMVMDYDPEAADSLDHASSATAGVLDVDRVSDALAALSRVVRAEVAAPGRRRSRI